MAYRKLSAVEELCLGEQARKGYDYLCFRVGQGLSAQEKENFWAIANNAALIFFLERSERKFYSVEEVLEKYSLEEIAQKAERYQQRECGDKTEKKDEDRRKD